MKFQISNFKFQMPPQSQRGSAIVLALAIISLLAVSAFSAARLLVSEIRVETGLEDASGAYLTAEAALENALVDYRKNRSYQVSAEFVSNSNEIPFLDGLGKLCSTERSACQASPRTLDLGVNLSGNAQAKELVIFNAVSPAAGEAETVEVDELIEKDIRAFHRSVPADTANNTNCGGFSGSGIKLCWNWSGGGANRTMEIALVDQNGALLPGFPVFETGTEKIIDVPPSAAILRFRPIGAGLAPSGTAGSASFRPAYAFNTAGKPIDSGITKIEATGFFGRSQRKLKVEIDRKRDILIGEFDFAVFSGGDL